MWQKTLIILSKLCLKFVLIQKELSGWEIKSSGRPLKASKHQDKKELEGIYFENKKYARKEMKKQIIQNWSQCL